MTAVGPGASTAAMRAKILSDTRREALRTAVDAAPLGQLASHGARELVVDRIQQLYDAFLFPNYSPHPHQLRL